jgi:hypothetical protein
MAYHVESHVLLQPRTGLYSLANRYVPRDSSPDGFTLVFAHSASSRALNFRVENTCLDDQLDKEQWEVLIARIVELFPDRVDEMWALDW